MQRRREHRRDRRAHDERGALLRRRRRHLRHRRAGHQGPVHEERRHRELPPLELAAPPATACCCRRWPTQFGVPVTEYADVAFKARARAEVPLRLRRLPRHRPRELPEGGLLARRSCSPASRRCCRRTSGSTSCRSRASRRSAASSCSRAARSTTSRPSRRRSTTSRSASRTPRSSSTRTRGEAGAIGAAIETLRVVKRTRQVDASSASMQAIDLEYTIEERRGDASVTSARTSASARSSTRRRPTARRAATSPASPARRAPSSARRRCSRSSPSARRRAKQFPNLVDYEAKLAFKHFYEPAPHARRRHADQGHRGQEGHLRRQRRVEITRPFQRSSAEAQAKRRRTSASASRAC